MNTTSYSFELARIITSHTSSNAFCLYQNMIMHREGNKAIITDIETNAIIDTLDLNHDFYISEIIFNDFGNILLIPYCGMKAFIYNFHTKVMKEVVVGHTGYINSAATFKENTFITCDEDSKIIAWNAETGVSFKVFTVTKRQLHFLLYDSKSNKIFASCKDGTILSLCADTGAVEKSLFIEQHQSYKMEYVSPEMVLAISTEGDWSAFDPTTMKRVFPQLPTHSRSGVQLTSDKSKIVFGNYDKYSRIFVFDLIKSVWIDSYTSKNNGIISDCKVSSCGRFVVTSLFQSIGIFKVTPPFVSLIHQEDVVVDGKPVSCKVFTDGSMIIE